MIAQNLRAQIWRSRKLILLLYVPTVIGILVVAAVNRGTHIPYSEFMRDTTSLAGVAPWTGIVSNLGVLLWCAAATLCFAGAYLARQRQDFFRFLLASGCLTLVLMLDDFFVVHESLRDYLAFPEEATYSLYLLCFAGYLFYFGRLILRTEYLLFVVSLFLLGISLGIDIFQEPIQQSLGSSYYLIEDGFKFAGIVGWFGYFLQLFGQISTQHAAEQPS